MKEEWRDIKGYEGLYKVSNLGRVKSLNYNHTKKEKVLDFKPKSNGYIIVKLWKNGKSKSFYIHRLVAEAFIPNPNNYPEINHKIDDFKHRSNNRVDNLEWCTRKYNNSYGNHTKRISDSLKGRTDIRLKGSKHPNSHKVICITTNKTFDTMKEATIFYKVSQSSITMCCQGKYKYAGKHPVTGEKLVWKYLEEVE